MNAIVLDGAADFAPVFLPATGVTPTWSGKSAMAMTKFDLEDLYQFCMDGALELGIESILAGEPEGAKNPFHPNFLLGMPFSTYDTFFQRGRLEATGSWLEARGISLFAENNHDRTAVPV